MANFKVLGGDFPNGRGGISSRTVSFAPQGFAFSGEMRPCTEIEEVALASEESIKRIGGTVGWGAAGAVLLGPVGLLAGLFLGGKSKEITFVVRFKDGKKFVAVGEPKAYQQLLAASMTK